MEKQPNGFDDLKGVKQYKMEMKKKPVCVSAETLRSTKVFRTEELS